MADDQDRSTDVASEVSRLLSQIGIITTATENDGATLVIDMGGQAYTLAVSKREA